MATRFPPMYPGSENLETAVANETNFHLKAKEGTKSSRLISKALKSS